MFKSSNITVWLSRHEERKILDLCKSHLDKVIETVKEMKKVVYAFCDEDSNRLEENYKKAFDSERAADDIKHRILQDASAGPLHPIDREEIIRLVLTADNVAENAKAASGRIRLSSTECLTDEIKADLRNMADKCVEIVEKVRIAVDKLSEGANAAIEMTDQVERVEESIDVLRLDLVKKVLSCKQPVVSIKSLGPWIMFLNAIENMEEVADRSEDVADVIRSIAILG